MSNMFDIDEVREGLTVSLHLPLGCGLVLFSVECKSRINLWLTQNK